MNKAIFWDRDGVLNQVLAVRHDGVKNASPNLLEHFQLVEGASEVLLKVKLKGFLNIIITNQPDIARSKMSWEELNKMHDFLKQRVTAVDAIYVCPHDNQHNCMCRKPKPGLLLDAAKDYKLNLSYCFMVGDRQKDIDAAHSAGVKSVLLKTSYNTEVKNAEFEIKNLNQLVKILK